MTSAGLRSSIIGIVLLCGIGMDVLSPAGRKIDYVGGLRITPGVERSEQAREIGVGRTLVRLTFGVRDSSLSGT